MLILGTRNPGKIREFSLLLNHHNIPFQILLDYSYLPEPDEQNASFEEIARKKAFHYVRLLEKPVLAEDSGLIIPSLGQFPGTFSARLAPTSSQANVIVLERLQGKSGQERYAEYFCALVLALPDGSEFSATSSCAGRIMEKQFPGDHGFGYDPIFYFPPFGATFSRIPIEKKNIVSHRGRAFILLLPHLLASVHKIN